MTFMTRISHRCETDNFSGDVWWWYFNFSLLLYSKPEIILEKFLCWNPITIYAGYLVFLKTILGCWVSEHNVDLKVLLWSKNSLLFFLQILKACLFDTSLAKSWASNFIQRLFSLSASLGFTVHHCSCSKLTDWTLEGWIEDKMTSKTH